MVEILGRLSVVADSDEELIIVGKISAAFGVKGWVKIYSYTDPVNNILQYNPWKIKTKNSWQHIKVVQGRIHGKGVVAQLEQVHDRTDAEALTGTEIAVNRDQLPAAEAGEYYWADLIGLKVVNTQGVEFGNVDHLLETGANDVLVVTNGKERLIPYVLDVYIKEVDLNKGEIVVNWDPDY